MNHVLITSIPYSFFIVPAMRFQFWRYFKFDHYENIIDQYSQKLILFFNSAMSEIKELYYLAWRSLKRKMLLLYYCNWFLQES